MMPETIIFSGGIFVSQIFNRPTNLGNDRMPRRLLTLSSCLTEFFPDAWAVEWVLKSDSERIVAAAKLDLQAGTVPEIVQFVTAALSAGIIGWPNVWSSLAAARAAAHKFVLAPENFAILELGVPAYALAGVLAALEPSPTEGPPGVYTTLQGLKPIHAGGIAVGWEILGVEHGGTFHTWLCNHLDKDAELRLGIKPGPFGLLGTQEEAKAVADLINGGIGAEPVPWFPALLTRHNWIEATP